ncbi:MAG: hypothetical protein O9327_14970 [Polaromonas sp.]|nr:hypothetical protein [Polaromonas sp.]
MSGNLQRFCVELVYCSKHREATEAKPQEPPGGQETQDRLARWKVSVRQPEADVYCSKHDLIQVADLADPLDRQPAAHPRGTCLSQQTRVQFDHRQAASLDIRS